MHVHESLAEETEVFLLQPKYQDRAVRVGLQNTMPAVGPPRGASSPSLALDLNFDHIHAGGFSRR